MENQFDIKGSKHVEMNTKLDESFMDKSVQINADTIMENVKMAIKHIKENEPLKELNKKLIMAMVAYQTAAVASPAYAEGLSGPVSYSTFLEGVKTGLIEKVRVEPNGRTADFINSDGGRGQVELFNDPEFLNTVIKNNVDLFVMNAGN